MLSWVDELEAGLYGRFKPEKHLKKVFYGRFCLTNNAFLVVGIMWIFNLFLYTSLRLKEEFHENRFLNQKHQ